MVEYLIIGQGLAGSLLGWEFHRRGIPFHIVNSSNKPSSTKVAAGLINTVNFRTVKNDWMADDFLRSALATYSEIENYFGVQVLFPLDTYKMIKPESLLNWQRAIDEGVGNGSIDIESGFQPQGFREKHLALKVKGACVNGLELTNVLSDFFRQQNCYTEAEIDYNNILWGADYVNVYGTKAKNVVFCEGANATHNPWFGHWGMAPNKGELIEIYAPQLSLNELVRADVFVLPTGKGIFKVGATYGRNNIDDVPSQEARDYLVGKLQELLNVPFQVLRHWAGMRPAIRDRKPIMGQHPDKKRMFIFNGLGSKGFVQAPYWSVHFTDWLQGNIIQLNEKIDVARFVKHSSDRIITQ